MTLSVYEVVMAKQSEIAAHLDMSERNAREVVKSLRINWQDATLDEIRIAYIRDLREKAAGRGGSNIDELNKARLEEMQVKSANGRLQYHEKLGTLVQAEAAQHCLVDWASFANREYSGGIERLIQEIESVNKITIDRSVVIKVAGATTERIAGYAEKLGAQLVGGSG
ncbi:MAG: hypothetical protein JKY26_17500 [Pseudomonas sp.]|nr:hypothetical protein [Pseudomonas sp.]